MKIVMVGFSLSMMLLCSGCMLHTPITPAHPIHPAPHCETSSLLLTNLTLPPAQRHYLLPNEQLCIFSNVPNEED